MKFLHTADLHIGASRKLDGYLHRQEQMLHEIYRIADEEDVDLVVILGDLYHRKDVKHEERDMFLRTLLKYDRLGFTTLITSGNHDMLGPGYTSLHFLKILENQNRLKNTRIAECYPRVIEFVDATFVLIPWAGYDTESFANKVEQLLEECPPVNPIIVCGHECIRDCTTDVGWRAKGVEYMRLVEHPAVKFYCFGDIHKQQRLGEKSWYSGSPIQHDFGDAADKGVLIFDTEKPEPEFHPLQGIKPLVTLNEIPEEGLPDAYVRIVGSKVDKLTEVPDSVLYVTPTPEEVEIEIDDDVLEGLGSLLARRGLSKDNQRRAILLAEEIVRAASRTD